MLERQALTSEMAVLKDQETDSAAHQQFDNFAFVVYVSSLVGANKFLLAPGHELRRASVEEIQIIKELLLHLNGGMLRGHSDPFESVIRRNWMMIPLPENEWRYFVIGFRGSPDSVLRINNAFCLADMEFRVAFTVLRDKAIHPTKYDEWIYNPNSLFQTFEKARANQIEFQDFSSNMAEQVVSLFRQLEEHDPEVLPMGRIAGQLINVEQLPSSPYSDSRFLGYFGILESLLTHRPNPNDPYDSITRQVKKKLVLLNHRWSTPLDYSFFAGAKPDIVWAKMYAYRSCLAHGATPDFTGELAILRDADQALKLLKSAVKAVARQALDEPRLVADLRDC
jgi:hypothetical protein